jgi:hypothetical protein
MTDHAVLIAGGGPTGLMLAGELALAATRPHDYPCARCISHSSRRSGNTPSRCS